MYAVSVVSSICLLAVVLVTQLQSARAVPGKFRSMSPLRNKWLPDSEAEEDLLKVMTLADCEGRCVKHKTCTGYSYSESYSRCLLYKIKPGTPPVKNTGYHIYIKMFTEAEGYYIYDTGYIRLMKKRMSAAKATQNCTDQGGSLVAVRTKKLNDLLYKLLVKQNIWNAYIGLSDAEEEGVWKWPDGGKLGFQNWDWKGEWGRKDLNCAVITNGFEEAPWKQFECKRPNYYFCQIPMF
ncbi:unnamed protein product [Meganyctiphanes norvegica]|uniref:C-type lectin domain-containing protein n=1 Tax=Meganyctiphanes norvegica TaxID=48144 RepID=A0AAV2Q5K8_MEGNR